MPVIAFTRRSNQPRYEIKKASQAIWIAPNGNATVNLECIIDLARASAKSPVNEIIVLVYSKVLPHSVVQENDLFLNANFCDYLYDGKYVRRSREFVQLLVAPDDQQHIKIAQIRKIEVTSQESYSRIRIFFSENLKTEHSDVCGESVKFAGFRIRYTIPKFSRKIKRHRYSEAIWTVDLRPYDSKVLGELSKNEETIDLKLLYSWIVLPRGFFVTAFAPQFHQIRNLELDPWKAVSPKLKENSICYSWKLTSPTGGPRLHLDYKEPSFEPRWTFWLSLMAVVSFLITLLRVLFPYI